jgi:SpoVK/Ycf46/Vps4 family AAA+-type ATPase
VDALSSLKAPALSQRRSRCTPQLRLWIAGCSYSEELVSAAVITAFQEKIHIPLPSATQRRQAMVRAWGRHQEGSTGHSDVHLVETRGETVQQAECPTDLLHALADGLVGEPLVPLLLRAAEAVRMVNTQDSGIVAPAFRVVAGLQDAKRVLTEAVVWPRRYADVFRSFAAPSRHENSGSPTLSGGILLFGPPGKRQSYACVRVASAARRRCHVSHCVITAAMLGTGKTLLPRALAAELQCALVTVRLSDVVRGEVGSSERRLREVFQEARAAAPSVVFIDEFQAMFVAREEGGGSTGVSTLSAALAGCFDDLAAWNRHAGAEAQVTVIAATNEPWAVDGSFLRPGRLGRCLLVGPLDCDGRRDLLGAELRGNEWSSGAVQTLAEGTEGFSGADLKLLCARAGAVAEGAGAVWPALEHFQEALLHTRASTSAEDMDEYRAWQEQHPHLLG